MVWGIKTSSGNSCCFIMTHEILVLQAGIKPVPPAMEARSLNHWTAREVPILSELCDLFEPIFIPVKLKY